jgi:hypothetical protein
MLDDNNITEIAHLSHMTNLEVSIFDAPQCTGLVHTRFTSTCAEVVLELQQIIPSKGFAGMRATTGINSSDPASR